MLTALLAAVEDATGGQDVILDALGGSEAKAVLRDVGLERQRRLARMTYREPIGR
ncbi:hypothetical protein [Halosolutus gelatinilyticus]|uniref:hypothetical protein n=1 Tax=Halosolutus gelatinilyticus TaxID=2931975 RepID=UPI001FF20AC1|nr:hypothetical protein [Halosolutus gelatinilyticus]